MSDDDKKSGSVWDEFWKGYEEQDAKIRADERDTKERVKEGLATGASEAIFNPLRWLRSLIG